MQIERVEHNGTADLVEGSRAQLLLSLHQFLMLEGADTVLRLLLSLLRNLPGTSEDLQSFSFNRVFVQQF